MEGAAGAVADHQRAQVVGGAGQVRPDVVHRGVHIGVEAVHGLFIRGVQGFHFFQHGAADGKPGVGFAGKIAPDAGGRPKGRAFCQQQGVGQVAARPGAQGDAAGGLRHGAVFRLHPGDDIVHHAEEIVSLLERRTDDDHVHAGVLGHLL